MADKRVFTDAELKEMGRQTVELVEEAIDAGDLERAKKLAQRMYREFHSMHDVYVDWVATLLSYIGTRYGDEALHQALRESCMAWVRPLAEQYANTDVRRKAKMFVAGQRGHLQPMTVEEDEEKFTILPRMCGSGGRLIVDGSYGPPRNLLKVKRAQPMTYGRKDFPVYCAHCSFPEILSIELIGVPIWIVEVSKKPGEIPCRIYLYKDPKAIPAEFYARLGKTKGSSR